MLAAAAHASSHASSHAAVHPDTVSVTGLFVQLVVGLGVVLAIIWVAARVLKGRAGGNLGARRQGALAVLSRQGLAKGVSVALVRAGGQTYLLGVTASQVSKLAKLDPDGLAEQSIEPSAGSAEIRPLPGLPSNLVAKIEQLRERTVRRA
jgi:flagellar biogenesis protein FliO